MKTKNIFINWLPFAVVITLLSLFIYIVAQQVIRLSANNPQAQIANDAAIALSSGAIPNTIVGTEKIEISKKLGTFIMVYNDNNKILASSAVLDGQAPNYPEGILNYTKQNNEDRVTWQPRSGVREATVAVRYSGEASGVVVAGRSLIESEKLIDKIGVDCLIGWLVTMFLTLFSIIFVKFISGKNSL